MTESLGGRLLVAAPVLLDPNFFRTVVFVIQEDADGAVGVILNRPSSSPVAEHLDDWALVACDPPVVFIGGPVEQAVAICLSTPSPKGEPSALDGVWIADVGEGPEGVSKARVFSGYAGWAPGQLEDELAEGSWMVVGAETADVFAPKPEDLWSGVLRRQTGMLRLLATYPPDPILN